ncbi:uncharacterized protein [Montipora capricornis]|uniref:uncharacterized protein n=1 Tax=Montipora capricornis TaxID=246305 RepID=UPI0035F20D7E
MALGLDTHSFLKCFVRMASRRGYPQEIVSDRGTNFIGADRELRELLDGLDRDKIKDQTVNKGVKWIFNPPLAPHFGGVHEVMMKAAKKAIRAILGDADENDEELMTTFTGVEALMNSRPLTYQSANPKDVTPLTPHHFLHGQAGGLSAPASVDEKSFNPRKRWRRIQELISGVDFPLREEVDEGMASVAEYASKMERNTNRSQGGRCSPRDLTRES